MLVFKVSLKLKCPGVQTLTCTGQGSPGSLLAALPASLLSYSPSTSARDICGQIRPGKGHHWGIRSRVTQDIFSAWCWVGAHPQLVPASFLAFLLSLPTAIQSNWINSSLNPPYIFSGLHVFVFFCCHRCYLFCILSVMSFATHSIPA